MKWNTINSTGALCAWLNTTLTVELTTAYKLAVEETGAEEQSFAHYIGQEALRIPSSANVTHKVLLEYEGRAELVALLAIQDWSAAEGAQTYVSGGALCGYAPGDRPLWLGNHDLAPPMFLALLRRAISVMQGWKLKAGPSAADVLRKHEEGLASLLYRGHEQAEVLADHLALDAGRAVHDDKERVRRIHNARLVSTLLYALYGYNSEHGTTTEQDLLLHRIGFALDPVPQIAAAEARDRVAATRRTAVANLMRNSTGAHYTGCPADRGGVCNCTWLVDGEVLRTWLDETTVFTTR